VSAPSRRPVVAAGPRLAARAQAERAARRRRLSRRGALALAVLGPLAVVGWLLAASPLLAVQRVTVTGSARLTPAQVTAAAAVATGTPLARVDTGAVGRRVRRLAPVAGVTVSRSWPRTLRLSVTERRPVAAVPAGRAFTLIDTTGTPFATVAAPPAGTVRLQVAQPGGSDPSTAAALRVLAEIPAVLRAQVDVVRASSPASVTLVLRDRRQVVWGAPGDGATKAAAVEALLRMKGKVYDVSAPGIAVRR